MPDRSTDESIFLSRSPRWGRVRPLCLAICAILASSLRESPGLAQQTGPAEPVEPPADRPEGEPEDGGADPPVNEFGVPIGSPYAELGQYELRLVALSLNRLGLIPVDDPWERPVCGVHYDQVDIFLPGEPYPLWGNSLHVTTRRGVIERAMTMREGDLYTENGVRDSEREIRNPAIYSAVVIVPVLSSEASSGPGEEGARDPRCVEVLVVTRDLWSVRPGWFIQFNSGAITDLYLGMIENNLLGWNTQVALNFRQRLGLWQIGPTWYDRHFLGSRVTLLESFDLIFDRENGGVDGSRNWLILEQPLFESTAPLAWKVYLYHDASTRRNYVGSQLRRYDAPETAIDDAIEERWYQTDIQAEGTVTRAFGEPWRHLFTAGVFLHLRDAEPRLGDSEVDPEALASFTEERLPRIERAMGPMLGIEVFWNRYATLINYDAFDQSEEIRRGPGVDITARISEPYVGADVRYVRLNAEHVWTEMVGDDAFVQGAFSPSVRLDGRWSDLTMSGGIRAVTPRWFAGRLVAFGRLERIWRNDANTLALLGADTGLRGYQNGSLQGENVLRANVEWRSGPAEFLAAQWGLALFADNGAAWEEGEEPVMYPTVGFGIRLMMPQFMSTVRSLDVGFPLRYGRTIRIAGLETGVPVPVISLNIGQVF